MTLKNITTIPINAYQYISKMLPAGCRYYPSCSEYAKWSFETSAAHKALYHSTLRILRCNQLFAGGIDYPLIEYKPPCLLSLKPSLNHLCGKIKIHYWFVPKIGDKRPNRYFVIKDYDAY